MAKNMTFNASIRLNSTQFKKGVSDIQRSLKGLQSSFLSLAGALGLGLSFNRLGTELMNAANKLSSAKDVLGNVSKGFGEYGENLVWLKRISNEYGQELTAMMNSFAQFRANTESSKLSLEQIRDVYESLTRAAGAFNLTQEKTDSLMKSVGQMFSRGTIDSERYIKQIANQIPDGYNLMAQAAYNAGLITENTVEALKKAIKEGKIMADDIMPSFSKVLKDVTASATFETLENSINRLKNSWTQMVESANFEGAYKKIVDFTNKVVQLFTGSFWAKMIGVLSGIFSWAFVPKWGKNFISKTKEVSAAAQTEISKILASFEELDNKLDAATILKGGGLPGRRVLVRRVLTRSSVVDVSSSYGSHRLSAWKFSEKTARKENMSAAAILEAKKATAEWNEELLKLNNRLKVTGAQPIFNKRQVSQIETYTKGLKETIVQTKGAGEATTVAGQKISLFSAAVNRAKVGLVNFGKAFLKGLVSLGIGAAIGGVVFLIGKIAEAIREEKRLKNIASDMEEAVKGTAGAENETVVALTNMKRLLGQIDESVNDTTKTKLINEVNKALGRTGDNLLTIRDNIEDKVIPAIDEYIGKLKYAAMQQAIIAQVNESTSRILQLQQENMDARLDPNYGKTRTYTIQNGTPTGIQTQTFSGLTQSALRVQNKIDKNNREIDELNKGINHLLGPLAENPNFIGPIPPWQASQSTLDEIFRAAGNNNGGGGGGASGATPQAALNKYKEDIEKLDNQFKAGAILAADYKAEVEKLNQKVFEDLSSFGWDNAIKGLATGADKALAEELKKTATAKLLEGLDDPEEIAEFDKAMKEEAERAYENLKNAWDKYIEYVKKKPAIGTVDDSDGYMYSKRRSKRQTYSEYDTHFIGEELDVWEKYVDDLNNYKQDLEDALKVMTDADSVAQLNNLLDQTIEKLRLAGFVVKDLKTKANIAELERDIEDLRKEGIDGIFNSITALADGTDRLYRAVQSLQQINDKTWQNEDLENFLTGINAIIQAFEVMKTIIEAVQTTSEIFAKIKEKNSAKAIALNTAEIASENAKASAAAGAAAAGAASSTAGIPIVGPALAAAAVASVVAAILAGMKKFATGGVVGGSSYTGDKNVIRVNAGEMVLTKAQQKTLFDIANGKKSGGGGQVEFKIRGADLVGTLKNYNRLHN